MNHIHYRMICERVCATCGTKFKTSRPDSVQCGLCQVRREPLPAPAVTLTAERLHEVVYARLLRRRGCGV